MKLSLPERLDSQRIYLERLRYEFAEEMFFAYASKPEVTVHLPWPTHRSIEDTRGFLQYAVGAWTSGVEFAYAIRLHGSNRLIGSIGCQNEDGKVQFGYVLSPAFWNQGFTTEATQLLLKQLRVMPEVYRIWTFIDVDNRASERVLLKCGLVEEARLEKWFRFVNQGNVPKDCVLFKVPMS